MEVPQPKHPPTVACTPSLRGAIPLPQGPRVRAPLNRQNRMSLSNSDTDPASSNLFNSILYPSPLVFPSAHRRPSTSPNPPADKSSSNIESTPTPAKRISASHVAEQPLMQPTNLIAPVLEEPAPAIPASSPRPPPMLTAAPKTSFESVPVASKGFLLHPAPGSLSSSELQEIVSRAIRMSAQDSFLRLVPLDALDRSLVAESARLAELKHTLQGRYRLQVQRRTKLLQSLYARPENGTAIPEEGQLSLAELASQLSEVAAACDLLTEELLRIADQEAQIMKIKDDHCASALAVALRKLNSSHGRRTSDLRKAQNRIKDLEKEREKEQEWQEVTKSAREDEELRVAAAATTALASDEERENEVEIASTTPETVESEGAEVVEITKGVVAKATLIGEPAPSHSRSMSPRRESSSRPGRTSSSSRKRTSPTSSLQLTRQASGTSTPSTPRVRHRNVPSVVEVQEQAHGKWLPGEYRVPPRPHLSTGSQSSSSFARQDSLDFDDSAVGRSIWTDADQVRSLRQARRNDPDNSIQHSPVPQARTRGSIDKPVSEFSKLKTRLMSYSRPFGRTNSRMQGSS